MERVSLLVSDLDGTLLGDDRALERFVTWYRSVESRLLIVYSSGRFLDSIWESVETCGLPDPAGIICGVGTEIHDLRTGEHVTAWPPTSDRWDVAVVRAICAGCEELEEQPGHLLSPHKVSYYGHDLDDAYLRCLEQKLEDAGVTASIVYSSSRDLDILPANTNKGTAAAFLAEHWGIDFDRVFVAGDTGNDADMFRYGFRGIVVANAMPELKTLRGRNIYHASQAFAAGVLEGLQYWLQAADEDIVATADRQR